MPPLAVWILIAAAAVRPASSDEILAHVADIADRGSAVPYSGLREYTLRNVRFGKHAHVSVRMTYRPMEGKQFEILDKSGTPALTGIVERLLTSEAEESRLAKGSSHEIAPVNYRTRLRGIEAIEGRQCYSLDLTPRHKSKYLLDGTMWVDSNSYAVVRLEGSTAASISMWIGTPQIRQEYGQVGGLSLPTYLKSESSTMWLGRSELEIRYLNYRVGDGTPDVGTANPRTLLGRIDHPTPLRIRSSVAASSHERYPVDTECQHFVNCDNSTFVVTPRIATWLLSWKSFLL